MADYTNTIAHLGTDIAGQMLEALITDTQEPEYPKSSLPIADQKVFLRKKVDSLGSTQDIKDIGEILVMNNKRAMIMPCSEGSIINLDMVPDNIITQMYELMMYKLNKRK